MSTAPQPAPTRSLWAVIGISAVLVAVVAVIYAQMRSFGFISLDDPQYVTANPLVRAGLSWSGAEWAFTTGTFYWHPLTWISHMLDVSIFGMHAGAFHLVNAAIHALNSVLLFAVLRRMTGALWKSAIVAAVFAIHPLHVESVAWISERKDVLSSFFLLASAYAYIAYAKTTRRKFMLIAIALFAAGLLAKPMILTLPFIFLLLDYWPLMRIRDEASLLRRWRPLVIEKIPLFALAVSSVAVTILSQSSTRAVVALERLPILDRVGNAMLSYCLYLRDLVWPYRLAPFYPLQPPSILQSVAAMLIIASLTMIAWRAGKEYRFVIVGWLWYLGTLLPVIGIVQAGDQGRADRFTYIPLVGILIVIIWGVDALLSRSKSFRLAGAAVSIVILLWLTTLARLQTSFWKDDLRLWQRTVSVTSGNYRAENLYGVALTDRGRLAEGISHYLAALEVWPDYPEAHNNLGTARRDEGRIDDAIAEFSKAVTLRPTNSSFHFNLGVVLSDKGDTTAAIREIETALRLDPADAAYARALQIVRGAR